MEIPDPNEDTSTSKNSIRNSNNSENNSNIERHKNDDILSNDELIFRSSPKDGASKSPTPIMVYKKTSQTWEFAKTL